MQLSKNSNIKIPILIMLSSFLIQFNCFAIDEKVPRSINFQGFLTDSGGSPITGTKKMRFGLYTNTTRIWYSEYATVTMTDGIFSVALGESLQGGTALNTITGATIAASNLPITATLLSGLDYSTTVAIEVEIERSGGGWDILSPTFRVVSSLFALKADTIDGFDSTELAKLDSTGRIISSLGTAVIDASGNWIGPSIAVGTGGITVSGGGAAITGNSSVAGTFTVSNTLTSSGQITATSTPTGSTVSNGAVYINPATASLNNTLFGVAVGGAEKFRIDAEGDTTISGNVTITGTLTAPTNADQVDGFHASSTPTASTLLPLNGSAKFPNSVLNTGTGNGLDSDMVDGKHAADFGWLTSANSWSGLNTYTRTPVGLTVGDGSAYVNPATAAANNTLLGVAVGGAEKFKIDAEGDTSVAGNLSVTGTITGNLTGTASSATNADTVDTFHASSTPTASTLLPLNGSAKFPNSVLNTGSGNGLDSDSVDTFHASSTPTASTLLPLDGTGKYPNSVLNTGTGNGLDSDMVDGKHAADFGWLTSANSWSGLNTYTRTPAGLTVGDGSAYINPATATANNTLLGVAVGGVEKFKIDAEGDFFSAGKLTVSASGADITGAVTVTGALTASGLLTASGGISVTGSVSLPTGSITSAMVLDNSIDTADINTEAVTDTKQFKHIYANANATTIVADCGVGYIAIGGGSRCQGSSMQNSCPCTTSACGNCVANNTAQRYWLTKCSASSASNSSFATCVKL